MCRKAKVLWHILSSVTNEEFYRLNLPSWDKVSRLDILGKGYTLEVLLLILLHSSGPYPSTEAQQADPSEINLLIVSLTNILSVCYHLYTE